MTWIAVAATLLLGACGSDTSPTRAAAPERTPDCVAAGDLQQSEVTLLGETNQGHDAIVDWAVGRFAMVGLELSAPVYVGFDPTKELCDGAPGTCVLLPDGSWMLYICEPSGETRARQADQRLTTLHELAHVWHFSLGDGTDWVDLSSIVGGEPHGPDVAWEDQTVERVADVVSWGLMNEERRTARGKLSCQEMYGMFVQLTGQEPLPPVNPACITEVAPPVGASPAAGA